MSRIALLVPCFMEADAVSNDVLGMYRALDARGHDVCVFATHTNHSEVPVRPLAAARGLLQDPSALAVYHLSTGWLEGAEAMAHARCRRVLKYHNVTPPEFFEGIDQEYVLACRQGRQQLAGIARAGWHLYLADSEYNLGELLTLGTPPEAGSVVPPFHRIQELLDREPDRAVTTACRDGKVNVLVVGRLAPNKGHATLLEAFAYYHRHHNRASRLVIVGRADERLAVYAEGLRAWTARLGLGEAVVFAGGVSLAALRAYYETAHAFAITSAHEGFCVPLIEAMALGRPVIALGTTAVPATVGSAGLVWDEYDASVLAESIHRVATDGAIAVALGERGRCRYLEQFTNEQIERQFLGALGRLL